MKKLKAQCKEIIHLLLAKGAYVVPPPNASSHEKTPLGVAVRSGSLPLVKAIVTEGRIDIAKQPKLLNTLIRQCRGSTKKTLLGEMVRLFLFFFFSLSLFMCHTFFVFRRSISSPWVRIPLCLVTRILPRLALRHPMSTFSR